MTETEDVATQCAGGECKHRTTCRKALEPVHDVRPRIEPQTEAAACGQYAPVKIIHINVKGIK